MSRMTNLMASLATTIISKAGPGPVIEVLVEVYQEDQNSHYLAHIDESLKAINEKLTVIEGTLNQVENNQRRIMNSPFTAGINHLRDAKNTEKIENKLHSIISAKDEFMRSVHLSSSINSIWAKFHIGICHQLLSERKNAISWQREAYNDALVLYNNINLRLQELPMVIGDFAGDIAKLSNEIDRSLFTGSKEQQRREMSKQKENAQREHELLMQSSPEVRSLLVTISAAIFTLEDMPIYTVHKDNKVLQIDNKCFTCGAYTIFSTDSCNICKSKLSTKVPVNLVQEYAPWLAGGAIILTGAVKLIDILRKRSP